MVVEELFILKILSLTFHNITWLFSKMVKNSYHCHLLSLHNMNPFNKCFSCLCRRLQARQYMFIKPIYPSKTCLCVSNIRNGGSVWCRPTCVLGEAGAVAVALCRCDAVRAHRPPVGGQGPCRGRGLALTRPAQRPLAGVSVPGAVR